MQPSKNPALPFRGDSQKLSNPKPAYGCRRSTIVMFYVNIANALSGHTLFTITHTYPLMCQYRVYYLVPELSRNIKNDPILTEREHLI